MHNYFDIVAPPCGCIELAFIVDASGSIGTFDWRVTKTFLQDIVDEVVKNHPDCQEEISVSVDECDE